MTSRIVTSWTLILLCPLLAVAYSIFVKFQRYGLNAFSWSFHQLDHGETFWNGLLIEKQMLFVGGHHAGGTTLLWKLLREHDAIGSFGFDEDDFTGARQTGADYAEGSFLQSIMPTFAVGKGGQCRYAKSEDGVDWGRIGETSGSLLTTEARTQLLNEWGFHWNENGALGDDGVKFLMEKTPTNVITARWLHRLFNVVGKGERTPTTARFVFIQRHPLATAISQKKWPRCKILSTFELVAHWAAVTEKIEETVKELGELVVGVVKLEDLTANPKKEIAGILKQLKVEPVKKDFKTRVREDPNKRYIREYCRQLYSDANARTEQLLILEKYGDIAKRWGYEIEQFCH